LECLDAAVAAAVVAAAVDSGLLDLAEQKSVDRAVVVVVVAVVAAIVLAASFVAAAVVPASVPDSYLHEAEESVGTIEHCRVEMHTEMCLAEKDILAQADSLHFLCHHKAG
jgi:hypothetical protein